MAALQQVQRLASPLPHEKLAATKALTMLVLSNPTQRQAIAGLPGCLQQLVAALGSLDEVVQEGALIVRAALTHNCPPNLESLAALPHSLPQIVQQLSSRNHECQLRALMVLTALARHPPSAPAVVAAPGVMTALARLLSSGGSSGAVRSSALNCMLWLMKGECPGVQDAVAAVPGMLRQLVALLGSGDADVQADAAMVIGNLALRSADAKDALAALPGCSPALALLLRSRCDHVCVSASMAFGALAGDAAAPNAAAVELPGAAALFARLVRLLGSDSPDMQSAAACALYSLLNTQAATLAGKCHCSLERHVQQASRLRHAHIHVVH